MIQVHESETDQVGNNYKWIFGEILGYIRIHWDILGPFVHDLIIEQS